MEILKLATLLMCMGCVCPVEISVKIQLGGNVTSLMKEEIITARDEEGLRALMTKKLEEILAENPTDDVTIITEFRHGNEVHTTHVTAFDVTTSHQEITTPNLNTTTGKDGVTTDVASSTKSQPHTTKADDITSDESSTKSQPPTTKTYDVTTPYVTDNVFSTRSVTSAVTTPYKEPTTADLNGMLYDGKRFLALTSVRVNKAGAITECLKIRGSLANFYNQTHMNKVMNYIRQNNMGGSTIWLDFWIGMKYDTIFQKNTLHLRDGTRVPISDYNWYSTYPRNGEKYISHTSMCIAISSDVSSTSQYLYNCPIARAGSIFLRYVLCEI